MDTKWKSKRYVLLAFLLISIGCSILLTGQSIGSDIFRKTFFQTSMFENQKESFIRKLAAMELYVPSKEDLKKRIIVTNEEIESYRYEYGSLEEQIASIQEQYKERIASADQLQNKEIKDMLVQERDEKIKDITLNFQSDEHVRNKIIKQKEAELDDAFLQISRNNGELDDYLDTFDYYLVDADSGKIFTSLEKNKTDYKEYFTEKNMEYVEQFGGSKPKLVIDEWEVLSEWPVEWPLSLSNFENVDVNKAKFTGYIGIPKNADPNGEIMTAADNYRGIQIAYIVVLIVGIAALIAGGYLAVKANPLMDNWFRWPPYSKLYADIRWAAILITLLIAWVSVNESTISYMDVTSFYSILETKLINGGWMAVSFFLFSVQAVLSLNLMMKRGLQKEVLDYTLTFAFFKMIKRAFSDTNIAIQLVVVLALIFGSGGLAAFSLYVGFIHGDEGFIVLLPVIAVGDLLILFFVLKQTAKFNTIVKAVEGIAEGRAEQDLDSRGSSALAMLAANVNKLKHGVKASYSSQQKSERLKTELITNVSHDLRTPLTSIITYTDLLKKENISDEERNDYIAIIDRKSKRLKLLIDDLFEASKMATGNIELNKTKVDIIQLLQQSLAEYDEKIADSKLEFRLVHEESSMFAIVDGQKIWRVFDNLIGNILKYSLSGTRVYINIKEKGTKIEITFKNISQFELGMNTDELFERFKRGDQSRHTEGSGLGLAIAKSIIDLHGGQMDIEADGDLFKVTLLIDQA